MEKQGLIQYQFTVNIGYPVAPSFFSQKSAILEKLLQRYPKYAVRDENIVFSTVEPGFQVSITPQNFTIVQDMKINNCDFLSELKHVWTVINNKLKISKIDSINCSTDCIKLMTLEDAYIVSNKFSNKFVLDELGITPEQSQVIINYDENNRKNIIKIMPGTVQNITLNIGPNRNITQQNIQESMEGLIVSINTISENVIPFRFNNEMSDIYQSIDNKISIIARGGF